MRSFIQVVLNTVKVFLVFTICTLVFYYGLLWLNTEYEDYHRYDEPEGRAVKVFESFHAEQELDWVERLLLFYELGE